MQPDLLSPARVAQTATLLANHSPLVHCLTNQVVQSFTANALLAVGAAAAIGVAGSQKVFELPLLPPWPGLLIGGVVGIGLSLLAGWWGTRAILHTPPALALREA